MMVVKQVWVSKTFDNWFLVPCDVQWITGIDEVFCLTGQPQPVEMNFLKPYSCTKEQALLHLRENWDLAVKNAKNAWLELHAFSKLTNQNQESNIELPSDFMESLEKAGLNLSLDKRGLSEIMESLFPPDQQGEIYQSANKIIKEVFGDILKDMPEETKDVENWATNLHQQLFAEEEELKEKERKEELRNTVRDSIAQRLRERGITPSQDF